MSSKGKSAVAGEQDQQGGLVPKLRFPEFRDAPAWELWPLKKLAKRRTRKNVGAKVDRVLTNSAEHGVVDQRDYFEKDIANPGNLEGYFIIEKGDYVYNPRVSNLAPVGPIHKNDVGLGVMSPLYTVFFFDSVKNDFYSHYFKTPHWHQYLRHVSNSGARHDRMAISADDFINMPVPVSNPPEQQKIADCLSSIDVLIAAEAEKLEALKDHKKGLMQQLFPVPGEINPRLRFSNDSDWDVAGLPEVAFFQEGPGIMAVDFRDNGVPLIRLAGVSGSSVTLQGCNYLDPQKVEQKWAHFRLSSDDLIISTSATFGLVSAVDEVSAGAVFYTGLIRFRPCSERLSHGYLKAFLGSPPFARQAASAAVGGGIKHFGPTHLKLMEIPLPPLAEQESISHCLDSSDSLIKAQTQKMEALRLYKIGLMQQLFPVADGLQT